MTARSATLNDVARLAGVSYQTVSRVLNTPHQVADATRDKVAAAMQQLNYIPNRVAQQLAGKQSRTLGLATSDLALLAPAQIASAIQHSAAAAGYRLVIAMGSRGTAADTVSELLAQRVDGLLINLPLAAGEAETVQQRCGEKPVLFLDTEEQATVAKCLYPACVGAQLAVDHLVALGHKQIGILNGPADSVAAQARFAAWQQALAQHGLLAECVLQGDWSAASGYDAIAAHPLLPQALLVANDQMALGAMRALHQRGVAIPQQMSLIGYDDTAESAWYQPALTTVRQDLQQLGAVSVTRIVAQLQGEKQTEKALKATLIIRETTGRPVN
ncbi:LacI family DNA-binding transcriptional regulator [Candidatus Pantoea multigeneris]|uniref:LacI family DNA-binding transcriptional regulator n=1 Tax=Candidatus Pantoea multigeneris TaxID=2608357 RepID=A0ABX0R4Y2_9GAMM|nr:LacI family DNA-binding transcriptional regulator [Pantoea multigeneris]NIF20467.1 LacI family DNA-binding transcriptional regulator [Pantoea multigeneris]